MSTSVPISGEVVKILPIVEKKNYRSRKIWIEIPDGNFPQTIEVEFGGDDVEKAASLVEGQHVSLDCNLRGRLWEGHADGEPRCFTSLRAWRVTSTGSAPAQQGSAPKQYAAANPAQAAAKAAPQQKQADFDDVPF